MCAANQCICSDLMHLRLPHNGHSIILLSLPGLSIYSHLVRFSLSTKRDLLYFWRKSTSSHHHNSWGAVAKLFDPGMLQVQEHEYASPSTILFQRLSVVVVDAVFFFGVVKCVDHPQTFVAIVHCSTGSRSSHFAVSYIDSVTPHTGRPRGRAKAPHPGQRSCCGSASCTLACSL